MGNCSQKSSATLSTKVPNFIRIMTDSGRIMELQGPKLARDVLDDFPGYGIYQRSELSLPLFEDELLCNGQVYYLLPFGVSNRVSGHANTTSFNGSWSFRKDQNSSFEVLPSRDNGVWRVKMAINSRELEAMLEENTEGLIEMMRSVAKSSEPSPSRSSGWKPMAVISSGFGFKFPASSRRLTA